MAFRLVSAYLLVSFVFLALPDSCRLALFSVGHLVRHYHQHQHAHDFRTIFDFLHAHYLDDHQAQDREDHHRLPFHQTQDEQAPCPQLSWLATPTLQIVFVSGARALRENPLTGITPQACNMPVAEIWQPPRIISHPAQA